MSPFPPVAEVLCFLLTFQHQCSFETLKTNKKPQLANVTEELALSRKGLRDSCGFVLSLGVVACPLRCRHPLGTGILFFG